MTRQVQSDPDSTISRRTLVHGLALCAGATTMAGASGALAQNAGVAPPTTITSPPRDFSPRGAPTTYFWDPDIIAVDPSFEDIAQPNTAIKRLHTGLLWAEGPAWSAQGRYLLWSDIPNNRQMRWSEDDGHVSVFRSPSNNSNGNSFDFQGRQLSCEHLTRRVVRYENDGTVSVLADSFGGKKLNSPNDVVAHPDGSYWFTDPPYGAVSSTRASPTLRAAPAIPPASSIRGSASRPASCRASASSRPTAIASIPAAASTSW
jgi:gluconolactonase